MSKSFKRDGGNIYIHGADLALKIYVILTMRTLLRLTAD